MKKVLLLAIAVSILSTVAATTNAQTTWSCKRTNDECSATYGAYALYAQDNGSSTYVTITYQKYSTHKLEHAITVADGQTLRQNWSLIDSNNSRSATEEKDHEDLFSRTWSAFADLPENLAKRFHRPQR